MIGFSIGSILRRLLRQMIDGTAGFVATSLGGSPNGYLVKFFVIYFTFAYYFLIAYCIFRIALRLLSMIGIEPTWKVGKKDKKIKEILGWKWYFKYGLFAIFLPFTLIWSKTIGKRLEKTKKYEDSKTKKDEANEFKERYERETGKKSPSKKDMKFVEDKDEDEEDEDKDEVDIDDDEDEEEKPTSAKKTKKVKAAAAAASAPVVTSRAGTPAPMTKKADRLTRKYAARSARLQRKYDRKSARLQRKYDR